MLLHLGSFITFRPSTMLLRTHSENHVHKLSTTVISASFLFILIPVEFSLEDSGQCRSPLHPCF